MSSLGRDTVNARSRGDRNKTCIEELPVASNPPPPNRPSFAEENAMRVASESLNYYDQASDTYHCSYGPPIPAVTVRDAEGGILVRVDPQTSQVVGFTIPNFKAWHAEHADEDGGFDVDLPPVWPLRPEEASSGLDEPDDE
jgi:hypothetical protein